MLFRARQLIAPPPAVDVAGSPHVRRVHGFLDRVTVVSLDAAAADRFAQLRAKLELDGTPIGIFDTMIAGHALALKATLFANNRKHFQKVKALKVENWVEETPRV